MADPICRWRNPTPNTICELVNALPHKVMNKSDFRDHMASNWKGDFFHTPYQLACQLGLYYESSDNIYYPRFFKDITNEDAEKYLRFWIQHYYVPNPYTKKGFRNLKRPVFIVKSIVEIIEKSNGEVNKNDLFFEIFKEEIQNSDILSNVIRNYSQVIIIEGDCIKLNKDYKNIMRMFDRNDKKTFFETFDLNKNDLKKNNSLNYAIQTIFYGAPGTGKSFSIKKVLQGVSKDQIIRTTFHPDSDYATFVGSYKPTMKLGHRYEANQDKTVLLKYPQEDYLRNKKQGEPIVEKNIEYEFIPQAFTNAYIKAYQSPEEKLYLIIEEINRGNCAQIFGDLFQLLDRNEDGVSEYPIKADADLCAFLQKELGAGSEGITGGELCLPSNLYIWATMNTSDQSLFPIDSAFKRRWDWEYIPIRYCNTDWKIIIGYLEYSWTDFQKVINGKIQNATNSEDKKIGDYFVNVKNKGGIISQDLLLNKIIFYLWNDVCKDDEGEIFRVKIDNDETDVTFSEFFDEANKVQKLQGWMNFLGVNPIEDDEAINYDISYSEEDNSLSKREYLIDDQVFLKTDLAKVVFNKYIKKFNSQTIDELIQSWERVRNTANNTRNKATTHSISNLITDISGYNQYIESAETKAEKEGRNPQEANKRANNRWEKVDYNGTSLYVWKDWGDLTTKNKGNMESFVKAVKEEWGINIQVR